MKDIVCPTHPQVVLVRLHVNPNQANKLCIPFSTKFWFCHECNEVYEILAVKQKVNTTFPIKKKRKTRSDKGKPKR